MKNYKITVAYDGSRYKGWQVLKNDENTIQGKLQHVLATLVSSPVEVIGSGRTDAGVHAVGQVANFHIDTALSAEEIKAYLNHYLPDDIAVTSIEEAEERFHARFTAISKTYRYSIHVSDVPDVFGRRFYYTYTDAVLNVEAMKLAAAALCGRHDFTSFCGNKHMKKSAVRTIYSIDFSEKRDPVTGTVTDILIDFTGDGFLQNMIRILTGTLIEVGSGRRRADSMIGLLESRRREQAGYTAPAQGLCLMKVEY